MSLATDYALLLREARGRQLAQNAEAVRDLESLLARTAARVRRDVRDTPRGILGERYRRQLLASLDTTLDLFRAEYKPLLDSHIIDMATIAADRERDALRLVLADRDGQTPHLFVADPMLQTPLTPIIRISDYSNIQVAFGQVPKRVLETLYARVHKDGLNLSQRLYNLDIDGRRQLANIVTEAIAEGKSARRLAADLSGALEKTGADNLRYRSFRIARTEINTAFREGHRASITNDDGSKKSWVRAMGWRLSPAHPRIDICDAWAGDDTEDLGEGNYSPENLPPGHPNCLCYTVTLLVALPDEQFVSRAAQPSDVPLAQRKYYGVDDSADE